MVKSEEKKTAEKTAAMMVCIHGVGESGPYGEILHFFLKKPVFFRGAGDLILKLDEIYGKTNGRAGAEPRRYMGEPDPAVEWCAASDVEIMLENSRLLQTRMERGRELLLVHLEGRRNASFQGRIRGRLTKGADLCFASALELLYLLAGLGL